MHGIAYVHDNASRTAAVAALADVFGDAMTAEHVGGRFTCTEADTIADVLVAFGHRAAAATWLIGHAVGDDDEVDTHAHLVDYGEIEIDDSRARAERYLAPVPAGHARVLAESSYYTEAVTRGQLVDQPLPQDGALDEAWWVALPAGDTDRGRGGPGAEHSWIVIAAPGRPDLVGDFRTVTVAAADQQT